VDAGAEGNGLREQDLTLDIALQLRRMLEYNGFQVVMTRYGRFVKGGRRTLTESLRTRCVIANQARADIFVSIHANAGGGTGTEVYALPGGRAQKLAGNLMGHLAREGSWANRGVKTNQRWDVLVYTYMRC